MIKGDLMKIAIVANSIDFSAAGGVGSFIFEISKALLIKHQELLIVGITGEVKDFNDPMTQELKHLGAQIECLKIKNTKQALIQCFPAAIKLRKILLDFSHGDNVVCNVHLKLASLIGTISVVGIPSIKVVETYHSQYSRYWLQTKVLSKFTDRVICCSASAYEEYTRRFSRAKNVSAIPNGINIKALQNSIPITNLSQLDEVQFCSVGRLSLQKGLETTVDAFNLIGCVGFKYFVIGDGEKKEALINKIVNNNIILTGNLPRNDALHIVRNSDMVLMPSLWEGLSIFQLEAMALGKPLMLSDIPAFRQVFGDAPLAANEQFRMCKWGYLVATSSVEAWKKAIMHFLNEGKRLEANMSNYVLQIANNYDISNTAQAYLDVFKSLQ